MNRFDSSRRGSALLVVLGMMSFIVVSAVAFSAYMRYSRLPSSYLRRTSATRLLAKAALAEAIDTIDKSIGNNPYPGVGDRQSDINGDRRNHNLWQDRVYVGDVTADLPEPGDTIATLNMEALAYIPPPFINEARYWSRRSSAGTWHQLGFDSGRYAFTAINVSDCFDVNRLAANVARDSSDLGRITLAHCFKTPNNTSAPVTAAAWDTFIQNYNTSDLPLVSVADLNLAANANGPSGLKLPFADYLTQGNNARFVKNDSGADADFMKSLAFVTDGYFPVTNLTQQVLNLDRANDQPFFNFSVANNDSATQNDDAIEEIMNNGSNNFLNHYLGPVDAVALYDYLDKDSVPLSLALPTTECVPMVTGIGLGGELNVRFDQLQPQTYDDPNAVKDSNGDPMTKIRVSVIRVILEGDLPLSAGFVFPFKGERGAGAAFSAQAAMTLTLVPEGSEARLRVNSAKSPAVITKSDWKGGQVSTTPMKYGNEKYGGVVYQMQSEKKRISVKSEIEKEEDALCEQINFEFGSINQPLEGDFPATDLLAGVVLEDRQLRGSIRIIEKVNKANQVVDRLVQNCLEASNADLNNSVELTGETKYVPVVQAWVRVTNSSGKTVDLVPACAADDETPWAELPEIANCSKAYPLVRFYPQTGDANAISAAMFDDPTTLPGSFSVAWQHTLYLADDPRFNFAPENLIAQNFATQINTAWQAAHRAGARAGDIFMEVSDAGYLQSKYELTNLLAINGSLHMNEAKSYDVYHAGGYNGLARTDFGQTPANRAMWQTYSQYDLAGRRGDLDGVEIETGSKGFRINPYTQDENIMFAALANTPLSWHEASTNKTGRASDFTTITLRDGKTKRDAIKLESALTYSDDENTHEKLKELAKVLVTRMKAAQGGGDAWEDVFEDLDWNVDGEIGGVDFSSGFPLHSVDKKFLYGYWRECFANRQQLFLVVVRVEPAMMGGGGLGQTPPQLGVRAVALVWRDPTPTKEDVNGEPRPHRTRVLFYRQLD